MNLDELRAFIAVVESGSLVSAARVLRYPRATLRRRIDELEARVGTPLLLRHADGVTPTPAGELMAKSGRALLEQAGAILTHAREVGSEPAGTLRVLLAQGLPPETTMMLVREAAQHARLRLQLSYSDDPLHAPLDGVDVALYFGMTTLAGPFVTYRLLRVRERLLASPGYLAAHGEVASVGELMRHGLFVWRGPEMVEGRVPLVGGGDLAVTPRVTSADIVALRWLAQMEMGVAYVPEAEVALAGDPTAGLVPVLDGVVGRTNELRLVVPALVVDLPKVKALLAMLRAVVTGLGGEFEQV